MHAGLDEIVIPMTLALPQPPKRKRNKPEKEDALVDQSKLLRSSL